MADAPSMGGVDEDEVKALAEDLAGPPTEAGTSSATRFSRELASLVRKRITKGEDNEISVFLSSEAIAEEVEKLDCDEAPVLKAGNDPISGNIWLASPGLGRVFSLNIDWDGEQNSVFKVIRDVGLGELPAFVIDWESRYASRVFLS